MFLVTNFDFSCTTKIYNCRVVKFSPIQSFLSPYFSCMVWNFFIFEPATRLPHSWRALNHKWEWTIYALPFSDYVGAVSDSLRSPGKTSLLEFHLVLPNISNVVVPSAYALKSYWVLGVGSLSHLGWYETLTARRGFFVLSSCFTTQKINRFWWILLFCIQPMLTLPYRTCNRCGREYCNMWP